MYLVRGDPAFAWLRPAHDAEWTWRGGVPVSWQWDEPRLTAAAESATGDFIAVDCLQMLTGTDGPIISEFARGKLTPVLAPCGEFWPVQVPDYRYWWFNCLACVEALDRPETDADWSRIEGDWGSFQWITTTRRLAFRTAALRTAPALFRIPEYPQGVLFGTEALSDAIAEHSLTGFRLDVIWSSDAGGVTDPPGIGLGGIFEPADPVELAGRRAQAQRALRHRTGIIGNG